MRVIINRLWLRLCFIVKIINMCWTWSISSVMWSVHIVHNSISRWITKRHSVLKSNRSQTTQRSNNKAIVWSLYKITDESDESTRKLSQTNKIPWSKQHQCQRTIRNEVKGSNYPQIFDETMMKTNEEQSRCGRTVLIPS